MAIIVSRAIGVDTAANRPAAATAGRLFFATDTNTLSVDTGAAWTTVLVGATNWVNTSSATTAFNALDPLTAKGDLITHDGTNSVAKTAGTDGKTIFYDSSQSDGLRQNYSTVLVTYTALRGSVVFLTTTGAGYAATYAVSRCALDFTRFREARIVMNAAVVGGSTNATFKFYDLTNSVDITGTVNVNSGATGAPYKSTWAALNSATYAGDADFELQGKQGVAADQINIYGVWLELR